MSLTSAQAAKALKGPLSVGTLAAMQEAKRLEYEVEHLKVLWGKAIDRYRASKSMAKRNTSYRAANKMYAAKSKLREVNRAFLTALENDAKGEL